MRTIRAVIVAAILATPALACALWSHIGPESQVDIHITGYQYRPDVAM